MLFIIESIDEGVIRTFAKFGFDFLVFWSDNVESIWVWLSYFERVFCVLVCDFDWKVNYFVDILYRYLVFLLEFRKGVFFSFRYVESME